MSHVDAILTIMRRHAHLTDWQISECTGIEPVQQVNAICRRLADQGMVDRTQDLHGHIVNSLVTSGTSEGPSRISRLQPSRPSARHSVAQADLWEQLRHLDPMRTLMVIPCSGNKVPGGRSTSDVAVADSLPAEVAADLISARAQVAPKARLDTSTLHPAWLRYAGTFYKAAYDTLLDAAQRGAHVLILSGGYGVVLPTEPIGTYNAALNRRWWPPGLLGRCLVAYAAHHRLTNMVGFLAGHTEYAMVVRAASWHTNGVSQAVLISPTLARRGGAMVVVPRAAGEAFSAFWRGDLTADWVSTDGLRMHLEELP